MDKWSGILRLTCQLLAIITLASSAVAFIFIIHFDHWVRVVVTVFIVLLATIAIVTVLYYAFDKKQRPPMPTLSQVDLQRISYDFTRFPPDQRRPPLAGRVWWPNGCHLDTTVPNILLSRDPTCLCVFLRLFMDSPITIPRARLVDPNAPPTILAPHPPPPSYEQSAVIEETRIRSCSNAPPAYNEVVRATWMATFSPPPFYRPPNVHRAIEVPFSPTSRRLARVATTRPISSATVYTTPSTVAPQPTTSREAESEQRRRLRSRSAAGSSQSSITISAPQRSANTSLAQVIIDCSKAEPSMFQISTGESVI
ncbi:unnamed protein product [Caenorhabditis auriculariae]|uniref:Uncharacterized protein n=1 Tax=Caenorhabditis auriculariae TaxID=2777116 RepID=A0A8S1H563_9PELO|nr:unnamed protein product [Caenorhabditis auriculariae]